MFEKGSRAINTVNVDYVEFSKIQMYILQCSVYMRSVKRTHGALVELRVPDR